MSSSNDKNQDTSNDLRVLEIVDCIQKKRELRMHKSLAKKIALRVLKQNPRSNTTACKEARALARKVMGVFLKPGYWRIRDKALLNINKQYSIKQLLKLHSSTSERLNFYGEVYKNIFSLARKPDLVLDIGSGFNALSYPILCNIIRKKPYYIAIDASEEACIVSDRFLRNINRGFAILMDITEDITQGMKHLIQNQDFKNIINRIKTNSRIVKHAFIFKTLDSLELINPGISKTLIEELLYMGFDISVSFALQSISGKLFKTNRSWFSKLVKNLDYSYLNYNSFYIPGEVFYVINANKR